MVCFSPYVHLAAKCERSIFITNFDSGVFSALFLYLCVSSFCVRTMMKINRAHTQLSSTTMGFSVVLVCGFFRAYFSLYTHILEINKRVVGLSPSLSAWISVYTGAMSVERGIGRQNEKKKNNIKMNQTKTANIEHQTTKLEASST